MRISKFKIPKSYSDYVKLKEINLSNKELGSVVALVGKNGAGKTRILNYVKDYFEDDSFCRKEQGDINLWNVYNLFTQANKSSYIDTFLDRNVNAFDFTNGIKKALIGNGDYNLFLSWKMPNFLIEIGLNYSFFNCIVYNIIFWT